MFCFCFFLVHLSGQFGSKAGSKAGSCTQNTQGAESLVGLKCFCHFVCLEKLISLPPLLKVDATLSHLEQKHKIMEEALLTDWLNRALNATF